VIVRKAERSWQSEQRRREGSKMVSESLEENTPNGVPLAKHDLYVPGAAGL
jgi:hypothetical protein